VYLMSNRADLWFPPGTWDGTAAGVQDRREKGVESW
jgi:hypothetical protein